MQWIIAFQMFFFTVTIFEFHRYQIEIIWFQIICYWTYNGFRKLLGCFQIFTLHVMISLLSKSTTLNFIRHPHFLHNFLDETFQLSMRNILIETEQGMEIRIRKYAPGIKTNLWKANSHPAFLRSMFSVWNASFQFHSASFAFHLSTFRYYILIK